MYRLMDTYEICKMECINSRCGGQQQQRMCISVGVYILPELSKCQRRRAYLEETRIMTIICRQRKHLAERQNG